MEKAKNAWLVRTFMFCKVPTNHLYQSFLYIRSCLLQMFITTINFSFREFRNVIKRFATHMVGESGNIVM